MADNKKDKTVGIALTSVGAIVLALAALCLYLAVTLPTGKKAGAGAGVALFGLVGIILLGIGIDALKKSTP
jgi:hypothetical protein